MMRAGVVSTVPAIQKKEEEEREKMRKQREKEEQVLVGASFDISSPFDRLEGPALTRTFYTAASGTPAAKRQKLDGGPGSYVSTLPVKHSYARTLALQKRQLVVQPGASRLLPLPAWSAV